MSPFRFLLVLALALLVSDVTPLPDSLRRPAQPTAVGNNPNNPNDNANPKDDLPTCSIERVKTFRCYSGVWWRCAQAGTSYSWINSAACCLPKSRARFAIGSLYCDKSKAANNRRYRPGLRDGDAGGETQPSPKDFGADTPPSTMKCSRTGWAKVQEPCPAAPAVAAAPGSIDKAVKAPLPSASPTAEAFSKPNSQKKKGKAKTSKPKSASGDTDQEDLSDTQLNPNLHLPRHYFRYSPASSHRHGHYGTPVVVAVGAAGALIGMTAVMVALVLRSRRQLPSTPISPGTALGGGNLLPYYVSNMGTSGRDPLFEKGPSGPASF